MPNTLYADRITNLTIINGIARFECSQASPAGADGKVKLTPEAQLLMPVDAMVHLGMELQRLIEKMKADGVLQANKAPESAPAAGAASPNF